MSLAYFQSCHPYFPGNSNGQSCAVRVGAHALASVSFSFPIRSLIRLLHKGVKAGTSAQFQPDIDGINILIGLGRLVKGNLAQRQKAEAYIGLASVGSWKGRGPGQNHVRHFSTEIRSV